MCKLGRREIIYLIDVYEIRKQYDECFDRQNHPTLVRLQNKELLYTDIHDDTEYNTEIFLTHKGKAIAELINSLGKLL